MSINDFIESVDTNYIIRKPKPKSGNNNNSNINLNDKNDKNNRYLRVELNRKVSIFVNN